MITDAARPVDIVLENRGRVSGLLRLPPAPAACLVLGHGAGAGMRHPFLERVAGELCERAIATLRYQFPYMERGSRRTDSPKVSYATVRAAVAEAARRLPNTPLFAGGKSFGGRMTSQAQAETPLPGVRGIVFFGFPLHRARQPSDGRFAHLHEVGVPMLFLQGTRDALADLRLLEPLVAQLGERGTLEIVEDADHSFHVPARSGRKDPEVIAELAQAVSAWINNL